VTNKRGHFAVRIAVVALLLVFLVVCGAHLGGLSHDDAGGLHSIAMAVVTFLAVALLLGAAARAGAQRHRSTGGSLAAYAFRAAVAWIQGISRPLRC